MSSLLHRSPSVGSLVNKIMEINPNLTVQEIIQIVRRSTSARGSGSGDEYSSLEVVNEDMAISIAQATVRNRSNSTN